MYGVCTCPRNPSGYNTGVYFSLIVCVHGGSALTLLLHSKAKTKEQLPCGTCPQREKSNAKTVHPTPVEQGVTVGAVHRVISDGEESPDGPSTVAVI